MNFKSYDNFNEICQEMCGGKTPMFLVTELFHSVATIKYIFPPKQWRLGQGDVRRHAFMTRCVCQCARDSGRTTHLGMRVLTAMGPWWVGPSTVCCIGTCLGMDYSYPVAPSISQTLSVCVVDGVTCLFGSDPPLFFYLLCFSASLWTSSLLLLPIAYLPSILLYDNKSMWVNNSFSQI